MPGVSSYLIVDELKAVLRIVNDQFDPALQLAIDAASSQIDEECDDQFWMTDPAEARVFQAEDPRTLWTGSFASTDDMVIELDTDDDGVFETTLDSSQWQAVATSRKTNRPYTRIQALGSIYFPGSWKSPFYGFGYGYNPGYYGPTYGGEW